MKLVELCKARGSKNSVDFLKEVEDILADKKVDIDDVDDEGRTALHYAAIHNNSSLGMFLIGEGANQIILDKSHEKPSDYCRDIVYSDAPGKQNPVEARDVSSGTGSDLGKVLQRWLNKFQLDVLKDASLGDFRRLNDVMRRKNGDKIDRVLFLTKSDKSGLTVLDYLVMFRRDNFDLFERFFDGVPNNCAKIVFSSAIQRGDLGAIYLLIPRCINETEEEKARILELVSTHMPSDFDDIFTALTNPASGVEVSARAFAPVAAASSAQTASASSDSSLDDEVEKLYCLISIQSNEEAKTLLDGLFLDKKFNINACNAVRMPLLHWVVINNNLFILEKLLRFEVDLGAKYNEETIFDLADRVDQDMKEELLRLKEFHVFEPVFVTPLAPASLAKEEVSISCNSIQKLLDSGRFDLCKVHGKKEETYMHLAVKPSSSEGVVGMLIEKGVFLINQPNKEGETPLHYAARLNNIQAIDLLIDNGANINAVDSYGRTPLHCAAVHCRYDVVKILIEKGAEVGTPNSDGKTVLSCLAGSCENEVLVAFLSSMFKRKFDSLNDFLKIAGSNEEYKEVKKEVLEHIAMTPNSVAMGSVVASVAGPSCDLGKT